MPVRFPKALLIVAPLLLAGCTVAATPVPSLPGGTAHNVKSAAPSLEQPATPGPADSVQSPTAEPTTPPPPSAPTDFTATEKDGSLPCPSPDAENAGASCKEVDLSWKSTSPGAWFRVYAAWTGEGDVTCLDPSMLGQATPVLETDPDETSAKLFNVLATGGGAQCLWITAVSDAGESNPLAPKGQ